MRISVLLPDSQNVPHLFVRGSLLFNACLVNELGIRKKFINTPYVQLCQYASGVHIGTYDHSFVILLTTAKCKVAVHQRPVSVTY